jgi:hypothetical protein
MPERALAEARQVGTSVPLLGQHTDEILLEILGLGSDPTVAR